VHETATYGCDGTRGCLMQFWPPDGDHMCSKHVEAWNKLTAKQKCCASSWLITEIKIIIMFVRSHQWRLIWATWSQIIPSRVILIRCTLIPSFYLQLALSRSSLPGELQSSFCKNFWLPFLAKCTLLLPRSSRNWNAAWKPPAVQLCAAK